VAPGSMSMARLMRVCFAERLVATCQAASVHDLLGPRLTRVRSAEGRRPHVGLTFAHDLVRASGMRCAGRMAHQAAADAEAELPAAGAAGHWQPRAGACRCPMWHAPQRAHTAACSSRPSRESDGMLKAAAQSSWFTLPGKQLRGCSWLKLHELPSHQHGVERATQRSCIP